MKNVIVFIFFCQTTLAATWYIRPGVYTSMNANGHPDPTAGVYGLQDGTSYANAFNGITSFSSTVTTSNDVVYICGTHVFNHLTSGSGQGVNVLSNSNFTIAGDYPSDPGVIFAGYRNLLSATNAYVGPGANGVYSQKLTSGATPASPFYINGTNIVRLKKRATTTWADNLGGQYLLTATNYVQLPDGAIPTTNTMATINDGWGFDLNGNTNITFRSVGFVAAAPGPTLGSIRIPTTTTPFSNSTKNITFNGCSFFDSDPFYLYPGQDNFSFINCEFGRVSTGIYSLLNGQVQAVASVTLSNSFIHDTGTAEYNDGDAHGIGIQGGNSHLITHNTFSNTGPAIVFWTSGGVDMKNSSISFNYIINSHTNTVGGTSGGIAIAGDNAGAPYGKRTGNKIFGNIINHCEVVSGLTYNDYGIASNSPDYVEIYNNTINDVNVGIDIESVQANATVNALLENNIIMNPRLKYYYLVGSSAPTNLVINYNLYYPATSLTGLITINPTTAHDANSVFSNPSFNITTDKNSFRLISGSGAIGVGTQLNYTVDIFGNPQLTIDIGAANALASRQIRAGVLRVGNIIKI